MSNQLPPPPIKEEISPVLKEWLNKLYRFLGDRSNVIPWSQIDTSGSKLTDIVTRPHSMLQAVVGSTEQVHVSVQERTDLGTLTNGSSTTLHKHDHGLQDGLGDDDHTQYVLATGTRNITGQQEFEDNIVMPKTSGKGILLDTAAPTFGWRDLIGDVTPKTTGVGSPTLAVLTGNIRGFNYAAGEDGDAVYHIPHDYVPNSELYLHPHWTHNGTNISGSFVITIYLTYAKGHQQASFSTQVTTTITDGSLTIANTPALFHRIPEIQITTPGGSATQLDTDLIETDGIILVHYDVATIPTITGGTGKPFLLTFDIHYQSTNIATKNKVPNFYA